jgi:hypothetical protein
MQQRGREAPAGYRYVQTGSGFSLVRTNATVRGGRLDAARAAANRNPIV